MAKNIDHLQHIKSNIVVEGKPKLPQADKLVEGELAINYAKGFETISLKNASGEVVTFSSDEYYTEQKLGSGFTGANSAKTVTEVIDNLDLGNEVEISSGETPTEETIELWVDTSVNPITVEVYTKAETDSMLLTKVNTSDVEDIIDSTTSSSTNPVATSAVYNFVTAHTPTIEIDQVIDSGTSASTDAVSTSAVYGFVTSYTPSMTVDQVLDNTTSASTNPVSSKAVYDAVTDNELVWTNAYVTLSGVVSSHTASTTVHVTPSEKENFHSHANKTYLDGISGNVGTMMYENASSYSSATEVNTALSNKANSSDLNAYADSVKYNSTSKYVEFYHGTTAGTKVFEFDASDFIIDGMVDDVRIEDIAGSGTCLVVDFNTASGKEDINIPISNIFNASNYYDKDDIDDLVGSGFTSSSITEVIISNERIVSSALNDLEANKLDATAYTPTDLSNYYTKSETSGATEISTALGTKVNSATYTGHTADTSVHFTTGAVQTQIDNSISGKVDTSTFNTHTASTVHMSTTEKTNLDSLETNIATISGITSTDRTKWDALTRRTRKTDFDFATLRNAITDQSLEKYGLKVGDYKTINGHDYVIAGLNVMKGTKTPFRLNVNHVGLIVIPHTTQAWNVSGNTYQSTYTYSTGGTWTTGAAAGYANSDLHHYMTETLLPIVKTDLGIYASGILKHNKLYSNAVNTSGYNRFGSAGGCSSSWAWYTNQEICALSEVQVYGSTVLSSSGFDTGEACRQLDVFRVYNMNEIFGWEYPWLRDVASASNACYVTDYGNASDITASHAYYVAALILFA